MRDNLGRPIPSSYLGNYSGGFVSASNPGRNNPGNTNMPGENNQPIKGSDVVPKQPTNQISLIGTSPKENRATNAQRRRQAAIYLRKPHKSAK